MRVAIVTNIPAPYRKPVFDLLADRVESVSVVYCAGREANRYWLTSKSEIVDEVFLKERSYSLSDGFNFVHNNFDVFQALERINPEIIITCGFNPTHLYAFIFSQVKGLLHISMTDGWAHSESTLRLYHRILRKFVYRYSQAFVCVGEHGSRHFLSYGMAPESVFTSRLCADNDRFRASAMPFETREIDLLFAGNFEDRKNPSFFLDVVENLQLVLERPVRAVMVGAGPLQTEIKRAVQGRGLRIEMLGFVQPENISDVFANSKLLLFPTKLDAWGLVANEAMAAGTPVICSPYAGCAGDLVVSGVNGHVEKLDVETWTRRAAELLSSANTWNSYSSAAMVATEKYKYELAADQLARAIEYAKAKS